MGLNLMGSDHNADGMSSIFGETPTSSSMYTCILAFLKFHRHSISISSLQK